MLEDETFIGEFEIFLDPGKEDYRKKKNDFKQLANNGRATSMLMNHIPCFE